MLNSQQMVVHMPMYRSLKFPANSMLIVEYMISLATFDLVPTEGIDEAKYYWPEADAFNSNFESVGVESKLMLANIGFVLYMIYVNCLLFLAPRLSSTKSTRKRIE